MAYDRQRLIDSIGTATRRAVDMYDKEKEAEELAQSARAAGAQLRTGGPGAATVTSLPPMALVDPDTLTESASLTEQVRGSLGIAEQAAAAAGATVVAAYELAEI